MISTGKELIYSDLLTMRKNLKEDEIPIEIDKMISYISERNIETKGVLIYTNHYIQHDEGISISDFEVMIPVKAEVDNFGHYKCKKKFHLVNAIHTKHSGDISLLVNSYDKMMQFIFDNKKLQVTPIYNVKKIDTAETEHLPNVDIDIYVGISPNVT